MKAKRKKSHDLMVTQQAIEDFSVLTTRQRLQWLDEMRQFLSKTLPLKTQRMLISRRGW